MNENEMNTDIRTREIKPREYGRDPLATCKWTNQWYSEEEYKELQRRYIQKGKDVWVWTVVHGKLCLAFYEAFHAYRKYLEEHAFARQSPYGGAVGYDEHKLFEEGLRMLENLKAGAGRKAAAQPGKSAEGGAMPAQIPEWRPVRRAPGERQKALPHA